MQVLPKATYGFITLSMKIPMIFFFFFAKIGQLILKFIGNFKET